LSAEVRFHGPIMTRSATYVRALVRIVGSTYLAGLDYGRVARQSARASKALNVGQRQSHVIKNINTYSTPSLTLCPMIGLKRLPDFSRQ
jgi:hypothetical protein